MSSIKLKGSTSGDVTITVPAAAGTNTVTIPAVTGTLPLSNLDHVTNRQDAKPIIINGAMEVWQRGTALASDSGNYAADRFWYSGTGMTSQRSTDAPSGFSYSNKLTYGSADMSIGQPIELTAAGEQGMFIAGQKITIAFYGKVDSGTEAISVVINARNSKFSGTNSTAFSTSSDSATLTTDWQRFTNTFTIPTINANNVILAFELAGISKTAYFTGIQAELGEFNTTTIPPFQHEAFQDNFFRCQRYYQNQGNNFCGMVEGTDKFRFQVAFDRPMRAAPSITARGSGFKFNARYLGDHTTDNPTIADAASTTFGCWLGVNGTSLTGNTPIYGRSQQDAAGQFLALSAEF